MFYLVENHGIENYAADPTPYSAKINHKLAMKESEKSSLILFKWFQTNHMKVNTDKSHLLLSGNIQLTSNIHNHLITSKKEPVFLSITTD